MASMAFQITWLGHAALGLETGGYTLLVDPYLSQNPSAAADADTVDADYILVTHGHGDHSGDALGIHKETGAPIVGIYDLMSWWAESEGADVIGFNKGGRVDLNGVKVDMVPASHSSTVATPDGPRAGGSEVGFILSADGHTVYVSGDTTIMADMEWIGDYYKPDIGILSAGGHFTMDMAGAAYAAKRYFDFKTVIPCHYKTFPILEQDAKALASKRTQILREQGIRATPHAQRSAAEIRVRLTPTFEMFPIVELIDEIENALKTPVQATVKREDEKAFALLNGSNLMFCEDAGRRIQTALNADERILDFWVRCTHYESLHPHNAVSVVTKGVDGGYVAGAGAPVRLELSRTK
mgnify:CR=1 FL=1